METTVDSAFIRRAVEVADLNAVRVALYQQTGDPELAQLPTTANLDEAQREILISKAVAWLEHNAGPAKLAEPAEAELRTLMNMATAEEMGDLEFDARRDLPAFKDFPWTADWTVVREFVNAQAPLQRTATPGDVAEVIMGLARSEYVTGQVVVVDGGLSLR